MYIHPCEHIYLAYYNQDLVCLDLRKDKYIIFNNLTKAVVDYLLISEITFQNNKYTALYDNNITTDIFHNIVKKLIANRIFKNQAYKYRYNKTINKKMSRGVKFDGWLAEHSQFSQKIGLLKLLCLLAILFKTRMLLKFAGINSVIKIINRKKPKKPAVNIPIVAKLIHDLNTACLYFPTSTKCLEWAVAYMFLAHRYNIDCKLVIGVQTQPFVAHAWVEYKGIPFSDSSHIASEVTPILTSPSH